MGFSMPDFESFLARHGEFGVQAIVECVEQQEGIRASGLSLEERWNALLRMEAPAQLAEAA